jgi:hypothetical protein
VSSSEGSYVLALIFYNFRPSWPAMGTKMQKLASVPELMLNSCVGLYYNYFNSFAVFFPVFVVYVQILLVKISIVFAFLKLF